MITFEIGCKNKKTGATSSTLLTLSEEDTDSYLEKYFEVSQFLFDEIRIFLQTPEKSILLYCFERGKK